MRLSGSRELAIYEFPQISSGQSIMLTYYLLSLAWLNFLVKLLYGFPFFNNTTISLDYYEPMNGYLSVSEMFFQISLASLFVCLCLVWMTSLTGNIRWRQRFLVVLAGSITTGVSFFYTQLEPLHIQDLKFLVESIENGTSYGILLPENTGELIDTIENSIQKAEDRQN